MDKENVYVYIHILEYHSVIKKGILPFEAACIDFKCILLSKIYHIEKDKFHIMSLIYGI